MPIESIIPVLNVRSMNESLAWFELFGWERTFTWNENGLIGEGPNAKTENEHGLAGFGGICINKATLFLCVDGQGVRGTPKPAPEGQPSTDGNWMTWWISTKAEVDNFHKIAIANNCVVTHPPTEEPWGVYEFHLRHPDGHVFRVSCGLDES